MRKAPLFRRFSCPSSFCHFRHLAENSPPRPERLIPHAALLRDHIGKEDEMLFPLACELIPSGAEEEVLAAFERVEEADREAPSHDQLMVLAERLAREADRLEDTP